MTKTEEALITETYRSALSVVSDKELIAHVSKFGKDWRSCPDWRHTKGNIRPYVKIYNA